MPVQEMLSAHPRAAQSSGAALVECIQACFDCAQACTACADSCLAEEQVQMLVRCIRLNLDCADICDTTGRVLSRQTETDPEIVRAQVQACLQACRSCGTECARHAQHMNMEHCRVCAESCRRCEEACSRLLAAA